MGIRLYKADITRIEMTQLRRLSKADAVPLYKLASN